MFTGLTIQFRSVEAIQINKTQKKIDTRKTSYKNNLIYLFK